MPGTQFNVISPNGAGVSETSFGVLLPRPLAPHGWW
jgi:hypothetical protein